MLHPHRCTYMLFLDFNGILHSFFQTKDDKTFDICTVNVYWCSFRLNIPLHAFLLGMLCKSSTLHLKQKHIIFLSKDASE